MPYRAWFQCINPECGETYPLNSIVYQCKRCNSLLEVQHDTKELARHSGQEWKELFEKRYKSNEWPYGSGVWGKKEWVLPEVAPENVVSLYEGGTNLFWAERFGKVIGVDNLWVKLCGNTHSGSFKDLGMTVLVSQVKQMISEGARRSRRWRALRRGTLRRRWRRIARGRGFHRLCCCRAGRFPSRN